MTSKSTSSPTSNSKKVEELQGKLSALEAREKSLDDTLEKVIRERNTFREKFEATQDELDSTESALKAAESRIEELGRENSELNARCCRISRAFKALADEVANDFDG
jgi:chromosome segregation ATPase